VDIDEPVDRILRVAASLDLPPTANPATDAEIESLRALVAPLRLPEEVERLYRRFQDGPPSMIDGLDAMLPIATSIEFRRDHDWPHALLSVAYESHQFRFVELHGPDGSGGGTIWSSAYADEHIVEVAPSLSALLEVVAEAWERGVATPYTQADGYRSIEWDFDAWESLKAERLPKPRRVSVRPTRWLPRWLEIEGLDPRDAIPRGATSTVAAVLGQGRAWTDVVTLVGTIRNLVGTGVASSAVLDDGTGELVVLVPRAIDPFRLFRVGGPIALDVRPLTDPGEVPTLFEASAFEAIATAVRRDDSD